MYLSAVNPAYGIGKTMEYYQQIIQKHWKTLEKIAQNLTKKYRKPYLAEEMLSEVVVEQAEHIFNLFDATRSDNVELFMISRFRLQFRKWLYNKFKKRVRDIDFVSLQSLGDNAVAAPSTDFAALDALDEGIKILGVIASKDDRRLVKLRILYGYTFDELANLLKMPESTLRVRFNELMHQLKWYGKQREKREIV